MLIQHADRDIRQILRERERDSLAQPGKRVETVVARVMFRRAPEAFNPIQFAVELWQEQTNMPCGCIADASSGSLCLALLNKMLEHRAFLLEILLRCE